MNRICIAVASATALFFSLVPSAQGQELKTGYFLDYNIYGSSINPALQPERTRFFLGAAVGDIGLRANSSVGVSSLFFPFDGELVTGLNENISAATFLGGLPSMTKLNADLSENILGFGFRGQTDGVFTTVKLNVKSNNGVTVPKSVFECLKEEGESDLYNMSGISFFSRNYAELAVSQSRKISDLITVGVSLKGLMGLADAHLDVDRMSIDNRGDDTVVEGAGSIRASVPYVQFHEDEYGNIDLDDVISDDEFHFKPAGFGLAADLGVVVTPFEGLSVSAGLTDLGFIAWKRNMSGTMGSNTFESSDEVADDIMELFHFKYEQSGGSYLSMLNAQANIGVRYRLPFAQSLSVGALYSTRIGSTAARYNDFRAGVTFTPGRMFSLAGSAGISSCGFSTGAAMNLKLGPVNIFTGIDGIFTQVTAQYLPVNPVSTVAKLGLSMVIGSKKGE